MKNGLWFTLGLLIGAAAGGLGTTWYLKRKEKESATNKEQYEEIAEEYIRKPHDEEEIDHEARIEALREEKKEKPQQVEPVNYSAMYRPSSLETEHPKDQGEDSEEEDNSPERQAHEYHQKMKDRPPKIISSEEAGNLPNHIESEALFFYSYDEVLVDENNAEIDEPERLLGDALTKYGFIDNEEKIIFVMNYELDTCYEVQKVLAAFGD